MHLLSIYLWQEIGPNRRFEFKPTLRKIERARIRLPATAEGFALRDKLVARLQESHLKRIEETELIERMNTLFALPPEGASDDGDRDGAPAAPPPPSAAGEAARDRQAIERDFRGYVSAFHDLRAEFLDWRQRIAAIDAKWLDRTEAEAFRFEEREWRRLPAIHPVWISAYMDEDYAHRRAIGKDRPGVLGWVGWPFGVFMPRDYHGKFIDKAWLERALALKQQFAEMEALDWRRAEPPDPHRLLAESSGKPDGLLAMLSSAKPSKPTAKWLAAARAMAERAGEDALQPRLIDWLAALGTRASSGKDANLWPTVGSFECLLQRFAALKPGADEACEGVAEPRQVVLYQLVDKSNRLPMVEGESLVLSSHHALSDPRTVSDENERVIKGAAWTLSLWKEKRAVQALAQAAAALLVKVHKQYHGPTYRSLKGANACIWALGEIATVEAVTALARLRLTVRDDRLSKEIGKAMQAAAEKAGVTIEELEEVSVPDFDLTGVGERRVALADHVATLRVISGSRTELIWSKPDGARLKGVPAAVKQDADAKVELKALRDAAKEIESTLPVLRARLERSYTGERSWPYPQWRERFLDHPLMAALARRLIWRFTLGGHGPVDAAWRDGVFVTVDDRPLPEPTPDAAVALWHPLMGQPAEAAAWRAWLMRHEVCQPFKQAHREIYPLTEPERQARIYSNRFAGHILRQHQYMALAKLRGWKCRHRMWQDVPNDDPTRILLPAAGLAAEYWIAGSGGDDPEVTDATAFVFVRTDQVRFRRLLDAGDWRRDGGANLHVGGEVPLEEVPALVFSEVMRDIDLFVGVASIGNDPHWVDGGGDAAHPNDWRRGAARDYWWQVSTAELNESAAVRRDVIAALLPKLAIAAQCALDDRFLIVRGKLQHYKIHLGSANVFIEPGRRYLCIVPARDERDELGAAGAFIPFEGDRTLSLILSKALMLADDMSIKDPAIRSQIEA